MPQRQGSNLPIHSLQNGKYSILEVLGQGGFGITYLALHNLLGIKVAIKEFFIKFYCIRDSRTSDVMVVSPSNQDEVQRYEKIFLREAKLIASVQHPNIVKVHDVFSENNTHYYVMDYIEGENLEDIINEHGALTEEKAIGYIRQVGNALQYLHSQNLNHLDIKPANIMLRRNDDMLLLIDLGLSKRFESVNESCSMPVAVSHGYAPLEQYKNGGITNFCPQVDIYALGATLYTLLTAKTPPMAGDIITEGITFDDDTISVKTKNAIEKAMEIQWTKRPKSIAEFLSLLPSSHQRKTTLTLWGLIVIGLGLVCGVFFYLIKHSNTSPTNITDDKKTEIAETDERICNAAPDLDESMPSDIISHEREEKATETEQNSRTEEILRTHEELPMEQTIELPYATWRGEVVKGKPQGNGVMTYKVETEIVGDPQKNMAQPGDCIKGYFEKGRWHNSPTWTKASGEIIILVM